MTPGRAAATASGATCNDRHPGRSRGAGRPAACAAIRLRRLIFGWVLRQARARVRDRENLRFERTRVFGRVRRIFVEAGKRLAGEGLLTRAATSSTSRWTRCSASSRGP